MSRPIDLVVTCTDRKVVPPRAPMRVRDLPKAAGVPEVNAWIDRLAEAPPTHQARDLYQGEMWACALDLEAVARRYRGMESVRLWVISAGFGLISADHPVSSYGATFSSPAPDFVGGDLDGLDALDAVRRWWHQLGQVDLAATPRTLEELARNAEGDVVVVLSSAYLRACLPDLIRAVRANEAVTVVSPAAARIPQLCDAAPRFDARLLTTEDDRRASVERPIPRGTRMSLNLRVGRLLIDHFKDGAIRRDFAATYLRGLTDAQPPLRRFEGEPMADAAVKDFIAASLADETVSKTALLRRLRAAGLQCEQKRFSRLYAEAVKPLTLEYSG